MKIIVLNSNKPLNFLFFVAQAKSKELPIINLEQRIGRIQAMLPLKNITESLNKSGSTDSITSSEDLMEVDEKENSENSTNSAVDEGPNENVKKSTRRKNKKKVKSVNKEGTVEKRQMFYAAETSKIFGPDADRFFMNSEDEIRKRVKKMNHATRFYLAAKFYRRNSADFETNARIESKFSKKKCCDLMGIVESSLKDACRITLKDERLEKFIESKNYLSPVEFNPQFSRVFFKKYASNYDQLNVGGIFKKKKKMIITSK